MEIQKQITCHLIYDGAVGKDVLYNQWCLRVLEIHVSER